MKEIVCTFDARGCYLADKRAVFGEETHIKFIVKPHSFDLKIAGETIRSSSCAGYLVEVSHTGEVVFCDYEGNTLAKANAAPATFVEAKLLWSPDALSVDFGHVETVDYYPHCDGEHDRWGEEWITERSVSLSPENHAVEIK